MEEVVPLQDLQESSLYSVESFPTKRQQAVGNGARLALLALVLPSDSIRHYWAKSWGLYWETTK